MDTGLAKMAERLAGASPPDGGGALTAGVVVLGAALCESIARSALAAEPEARDAEPDARGAVVQAATLRTRAVQSHAANRRAYAAARDALRSLDGAREPGRDAMLRARLLEAADTLLSIVADATDCAWLAAEIARLCAAELRPDAAAVADLAAAAAGSAARLVDANLALLPGDERRVRARSLVSDANAAAAHTGAVAASG